MNWDDIKNQRNADGDLTSLALAIDAIEDRGCDCGTDEPGTCIACLCETALKELWYANNTINIKIKRMESSICPKCHCKGSTGLHEICPQCDGTGYDIPLPSYQTDGAVGMDLFSTDNVDIFKGEVVTIQTGISIAVPFGYEAQIRDRSSMVMNGIVIDNSPATIDYDYRGEIMVMLRFRSKEYFYRISRGDRIAQLVIAPVMRATWEEVLELDYTDRGDGGFGSTGK